MSTFAAAARRHLMGRPVPSMVHVVVGSALLPVNDSVTVPVTLVRQNFSGTVTMAATGLPTGVSASFEPATLSGAQSVTTMTLTSTALAAEGAVTITVRAISELGGLFSDTCAVTITNAEGVFALLTGHRFDGGSDEILLSTGIPLHPTQLHQDVVSAVGLFVGETQIPCHLTPLGARYAGGYVVSLRVQARIEFPHDEPVVASLRVIDTPLERMDAAEPPSVPDGLWGTDTGQLCSAEGVFGHVVPLSDWPLDDMNFRRWATEFATYYTVHPLGWTRGTQSNEAAWGHASMYAVTGNIAYLRAALQIASAAATLYYLPNEGGVDWHFMPESMAVAYLLTGAQIYTQSVNVMAGDSCFRLRAPFNPHLSPTWELRGRNRCFRWVLAAKRLGYSVVNFAPSTTNWTYTVDTELAKFTTTAISIQWPSGLFCWTDEPVIKWFMTAEYLIALCWWADMHQPANHAEIVTAVGACLDAMWPYYETPGLPYTTPGEHRPQFPDDGNPSRYEGELNSYWFYPVLWYARQVGGETGALWKARASTMLTDRFRNLFFRQSSKPFDQFNQFFAQAVGARALIEDPT